MPICSQLCYVPEMAGICSALIKEGINIGKQCTRKASLNGVCMKHNLSDRCAYIHPYGEHVGLGCERPAQKSKAYCIHHDGYENGQCNAMIEQGKNKGTRCSRPCTSKEINYCGKHISESTRNYILTNSKFICYSKRCNNEVEHEKSYCEECIKHKEDVLKTKTICKAIILQGARKGEQCTFTTDGEYCDKHSERCYIIEVARSLGKNVCGHGMRCKELIPKNRLYCEVCVRKRMESETKLFIKRRENILCCIDCGKTDIVFANTIRGEKSRYCVYCYDKMRSIEDLRSRPVGKEGFKNSELYYERYKYDAIKRTLEFALSYSEFISIVSKSCNYCGHYDELSYNGIDRYDNSQGYLFVNCRPACSMCNIMKSDHDAIQFINHCKAIHLFKTENTVSDSRLTWAGQNNSYYVDYKNKSIRRGLSFELDEDIYMILKTSDCYLCGNPASDYKLNGIDRIDSSDGYTIDNVAPCCPYCNRMKNKTEYDIFMKQCEKIYKHS